MTALSVLLCAAASLAAAPDSLTLDDVGVSRRVDLERKGGSSSYLFPTWIHVTDVNLGFSPACNPFSADIPADGGKLEAVCYIDGDKDTPLSLGFWDPAEYVELKDPLAEGNIVWRYWKVRFDETIVSLSRLDARRYHFGVRIPYEKLCPEDAGLNRASFQLSFTPDGGGPAKTLRFAFRHCKRTDGPPPETRRFYASPDHNGLQIATRSGSPVSSVILAPSESKGAAQRLWHAEPGSFSTAELLSGDPVTVEKAVLRIGRNKLKGTLVLKSGP